MLFSWIKRKVETSPLPSQPNLPSALKKSVLDWGAFTDSHGWPSIKIWLSADTTESLGELAEYRGQSRSEVMRDLLFLALYGHYTYAQLISEHRGLLRDSSTSSPESRVFFDIKVKGSGPPEPFQPKKTKNLRLFIPPPMQTLIEQLAAKENYTTSEVARRLIEETLYGKSDVRKIDEGNFPKSCSGEVT